jgi:hypothetical protein
MPQVGFESTIPVFERAKTVHALDRAATVIDNQYKMRSRDSSVGTATGYGLDGRGSIPGRGKIFLLSTVSIPVLRSNQSSYPMGTGGSFRGVKAAGA